MRIFTLSPFHKCGRQFNAVFFSFVSLFTLGAIVTSSAQVSNLKVSNFVVSPSEILDSTNISFTIESDSIIYQRYVDVFISTDSTLQEIYYWVDNISFDTINQPENFSKKVNINSYVVPGNYYLVLSTPNFDSSSAYYQKILGSSPVTLLNSTPDLFIHNHYSGELNPGNLNTINYSVFKTGRQVVDSLEVHYFLSSDSVYNEDTDIKIGNLNRSPYFPFYPEEHIYDSVITPSEVPAGDYYLITVVDPFNSIVESNETNNVSARSVKVQQPNVDLDIVYYYTSFYPYDNYIGLNLHNFGSSINLSTEVGYYLSNDTVLDLNTDSLIGSSVATWYNHSDAYSNFYFPKPAAIPGQKQYLIAVVDYKNTYKEFNESNNSATILINSDMDLTLINPYESNATFTNSYYNKITTIVKNSGMSKTPISEVSFELYDGENRLLSFSNYYVNEIEPNGLQEVPFDIYLPFEGVFRLVTTVDYYNNLQEMNEFNNRSEQKIVYFTITGTEEALEKSEVTVSPSPAQEEFTISNPNGNSVNYTLFNQLGEQVWQSQNVTTVNTNVKCQEWNKGIYLLKTESEGKVSQKKVVIY